MAEHDLIFFEKRSTPKVVSKGAKFKAPEAYGKQTKRRPATEAEEKIIARGDWVRVDEKGKKGGEDGYKKTRMKGREHLVKHSESLSHYGVKGMKWGVRKDPEDASPISKGSIVIRKDGSMSVPEGSSLQRLTRSNGKSLPMKDITYASLNDYDNAKYIKAIGGKGFFGGGRDQILSIVSTKPIEAPSKKEATKIVSDLMINNSEFRKNNRDYLGDGISKRDLNAIRKDPTGKVAERWYDLTNTKLTFSKDFDPQAPYVQKEFKKAFQEKGFNAVRDENDVAAGISKSPIIIFSPESSLKVVGVSQINDDLRKANKEKLKSYKKQGKKWLDSELYG